MMEQLSIYHPAISKQEGERRLAVDGRDGSYLIRNSESMPEVYCLCVLCQGFVYTYRLRQDGGGSWTADTADGVEKRHFRKIENMIAALEKPDQGIAVPLYYPITRERWATPQRTHAGVRQKTGGPSQTAAAIAAEDKRRYSKIMVRYKIQCKKK